MKIFSSLILLIALTSTPCRATDLDDFEKQNPTEIDKIASQIQAVLAGPGWQITQDWKSITVIRTNVQFLNPLQLPYGINDQELWKTRSFTSSYRITITFDTKLTQSEYDDIAKLRHDLIAKRTAGLKPGMEYYEANGQAQGVIRLPDYYLDRFTVYFYYSDKDSIFELRPDSIKSTRDKIVKILESSCSKYATASGQTGPANASRPVHSQTN